MNSLWRFQFIKGGRANSEEMHLYCVCKIKILYFALPKIVDDID